MDLNQQINEKKVCILLAVHNEESVIAEKLDSILENKKKYKNFEILIGSDFSNDRTNEILNLYSNLYSFIYIKIYNERKGKIKIINELAAQTDAEIIILTDANVIFSENLISAIVAPFSDHKVGLVESNMINTGINISGISFQESSYLKIEKKIKKTESEVFGMLMGPFGGCYAIRKTLYENVPSNFIVDDFFICMNILIKGFKAVSAEEAFVYEDVSNNLGDEFKRKVRISTGNFQNLFYFAKKLKLKNLFLSIIFILHKVLRWVVPFLILTNFITSIMLSQFTFFKVVCILYSIVFFIPLVDFIMKKINIHLVLFRFASHFLSMNLALLIGFLNYLKGVKTNVWQPTKRNQTKEIES